MYEKLITMYIPHSINDVNGVEKKSLIPDAIKFITALYPGINGIVMAPGYMSVAKTKDFVDNLMKLGFEREMLITLLNGMNGTWKVRGEDDTYREKHEQAVSAYNHVSREKGVGTIRLIPDLPNVGLLKGKKDPRKMMILLENPFGWPEITGQQMLDEKRLIDEVNKIKVRAVLIGSSNQSYQTYFSPNPEKGEADVMMFVQEYGQQGKIQGIDDLKALWVGMVNNNRMNDQYGNERLEEDMEEDFGRLLQQVVISESISIGDNCGKSPYDFLEKILIEVVKSGIELLPTT